MDDHPFEVGGYYRNEIGDYEVLAIKDERMRVRYDDGAEQTVRIDIQARIWQRFVDQSSPPPVRARVSGDDSLDIQPIIDLVEAVLGQFKQPYPENITDQLCLAIEKNPAWLERYHLLVDHYSSGGRDGKSILNQNIGYYTADLAGMVSFGKHRTAESTLIGTFSLLKYPDIPPRSNL